MITARKQKITRESGLRLRHGGNNETNNKGGTDKAQAGDRIFLYQPFIGGFRLRVRGMGERGDSFRVGEYSGGPFGAGRWG